jgi:hypothetical protein
MNEVRGENSKLNEANEKILFLENITKVKYKLRFNLNRDDINIL